MKTYPLYIDRIYQGRINLQNFDRLLRIYARKTLELQRIEPRDHRFYGSKHYSTQYDDNNELVEEIDRLDIIFNDKDLDVYHWGDISNYSNYMIFAIHKM